MPTEADLCANDGHNLEVVERFEWKTGIEKLDRLYETVVYECRDCHYKRWSKEERQQQLAEWGAA